MYVEPARRFFADIAARYGDEPAVVYELFNEPRGGEGGPTWPEIKAYADAIIPVIRAHDPDGVVLVGSPHWSQRVDIAARDPLQHDNVMYTLHHYSGSHDLDTTIARIDTALGLGAAIFVTEWGPTDYAVRTADLRQAARWLDLVDARGLSWVMWSLGNKDEPASVLRPEATRAGPWTRADLSTTGTWFVDRLRSEQSGGMDGCR